MDKAYYRIDWKNEEKSTDTPINDVNLNKMDSALNEIDNRVVQMDTTKAKQSDMLESVKSIEYNETTGLFVFTWHNGTSKEVDLNIEKIPVSFSMSSDGIITMVTSDGTEYTADIGSLITNYNFEDTSVITFSKRTAQDGTEIISANIPDGSITGNKLQPNYLADVTVQAANALRSETNAALSEIKAKGSEDRAKQYADQAAATDVGQLIPRVAALETGKADETEVSAIKESLTQFKDDGFLPKNLLSCAIESGTWNAQNGQKGSSDVTRARSADLVFLPKGTYTLTKNGIKQIANWLVYDANRTYIASEYKEAQSTITLDADRYVAFYRLATDFDGNMMIEEGTEAHSYTPYAMSNTGLTKLIDDAIDGGYIQNKNLLNWNDLEEGKKFQSTTIINDSNWGIAYIPYRLGEPISISGYASVGLSGGIGFADANKNIIEVVQTQSVGGTYSTSNPNAKYFCASVVSNTTLGAYRHDMQIEYGSVSSYVERVPSNTELKQSLAQLVKLEDISNTFVLNGNFSVTDLKIVKNNKLISFYMRVSSGTPITGAQPVGMFRDKPINRFAFFKVIDNQAPYGVQMGCSAFINNDNKTLYLSDNGTLGVNKGYFIEGIYLCE